METEAVDNCPERMDAADAEAPRPPRIETAVEFWSGLETVEEATMLSLETAGLRRFLLAFKEEEARSSR